MNKVEFNNILEGLKSMYGADRFPKFSEFAMDAWYEAMKDLDFKQTKLAIANYIKVGKYPPTVADIREQYGLIEKQNKHSVDSIKAIFAEIRRYYPAEREDKEEAEKVFINEVTGKENCLDYAMAVKNTVIDYVSRCEQGACEMDMTLSECIRWAVS